MKRASIEEGAALAGSTMLPSGDGGLIDATDGLLHTISFSMTLQKDCKIRAKVAMVDTLYNAFRVSIKETAQVAIRYKFKFPVASPNGELVGTRPSLTG